MTTLNCAACAERLPDEARYCPSCGVAVPSVATEVMPAYLRQEDDAEPAPASLTHADANADEASSPELALLRQLWADRRRRRRRRRIIGAAALAVVVVVAGIGLTWRRADAPHSAANATPTAPAAPAALHDATSPQAAPPPRAEPAVTAQPQAVPADVPASAPPREAVAPAEPHRAEAGRAGVVAGARSVTTDTTAGREPPAPVERPRRPQGTTSVPAPAAAPAAAVETGAAQRGRAPDEAPSGDGGAAIDWLFKESPAGR